MRYKPLNGFQCLFEKLTLDYLALSSETDQLRRDYADMDSQRAQALVENSQMQSEWENSLKSLSDEHEVTIKAQQDSDHLKELLADEQRRSEKSAKHVSELEVGFSNNFVLLYITISTNLSLLTITLL